jgi:hypothetical protein
LCLIQWFLFIWLSPVSHDTFHFCT